MTETRGGRGGAVLLAALLLVAPGAGAAAAAADLPAELAGRRLVADYLEALGRGDPAAAGACWRMADRDRADRLGIRYVGLPLKLDGDSPVGRAAGGRGLAATQVASPGPHPLSGLLPGAPVRLLRVTARGEAAGGGDLRHDYLMAREHDAWRLAAPVAVALEACAGRAGAVQTGRYVRAVTGPGMDGRRPALAALDSFVAVVLDRLGVPPARRALLEREKIDYLFARPELVEALAGAPTVGVANLQVDAVVTHHPCHLHELAHLLINFRLQALPLFTHPLLQEGLAVHLGGRWGRGPGFMAQAGRIFLADGFVALSDLLERRRFLAQGADVTYPAAGVVAGWVLDEAGADTFAVVYRALSGAPADLDALAAGRVAAVLGGALGLPEADAAALETALTARLARLPPNPVRAAPARPEGEPVRTFADGDVTASLWLTEEDWVLEVAAPRGARPAGALLVPGGPDTPPSALFAEHFPGYGGGPVAAAFVFSPEEAGWYDYGRDLLLAKHIDAFRPEPPCWDEEARTLRLAWARGAAPWSAAAADFVLRRAPAR